MIKKILFTTAFLFMSQAELRSHCQMPCGIYHDDMVFDQIDQYIETTVKGITVLEQSKFNSVQERNEFVRWVMQKENSSNEIANLICTYFLQQKIKPDDEDTIKRVVSAHKMLFLLVQIKQSVNLKVVNDFYEEWEKFKLFFHIEGYKCKMEQVKLKRWAERQKLQQTRAKQGLPPLTEEETAGHHDHDHDDHSHDHEHDHSH